MSDTIETPDAWEFPTPGEVTLTYRVTDPDGDSVVVSALRAVTLKAEQPHVPGPLVLFSSDGRPAAIFAPGHWTSCVAE